MGNGDESREDGERKGDKDGDLMLLGDVLWRFMTKWRWRTPDDKWMTPRIFHRKNTGMLAAWMFIVRCQEI